MDLPQLKTRYRNYFLSMPGVVGLGIGDTCDGECLRVYTERPKVELPRQVEGIPIEPYHAGAFRKFSVVSYPPTYYQQVFRPAPAGVSIGTYSTSLREGVEGTLGLVVRDPDGSLLVLGNNHIVAGLDLLQYPTAEVGQRIQQPGGSNEDLAGLLRWVPLDLDNPNLVDCALAQPLDQSLVDPQILGVGQPSYIADPLRGMDVAKVGMSSGFTIGSVLDVDASVRVSYGNFTVTLDNQMVISNTNFGFAQPGDSGAMIIARVYNKLLALGLLVGGSDRLVVANRAALVQDALGFSMPRYSLSRNPATPMVAFAGAVLAPLMIK